MGHIKVEVFIPEVSVSDFINKINDLGVLKEDNYDYCYSETKVIGNFRPLEGANPTIGEVSKREVVNESKLEFRIDEKDLQKVHRCILENHPYEVPVINYINLLEV